MSNVIVARWIPHAVQAVLAIAWLIGAADVIVYVDEAGGGKGVAGLVLFGPVILFYKPLMALVQSVRPQEKQWTIVLMVAVLASPCLIALAYTRTEFGAWIHPSWF